MTLQANGTITIDDLSNEFKRMRNTRSSLSEFYRNGGRVPNAPQNTRIPTSGSISLNHFYSAQNEIQIVPPYDSRGIIFDFNLLSEFRRLYGEPPGAVNVRLINTSGGSMLASGLGYCCDLGAFPAGSQIIFENFGWIHGMGGFGGAPGQPGGGGGHAIFAGHAVYASCSVQIFNSGNIWAGGGGGGGGGNGGGGFYDTQYEEQLGQPGNFNIFNCDQNCRAQWGDTAYCAGGCGYYGNYGYLCTDCRRPASTRTYTNGGGGGGGGRGQGWDSAPSDGGSGANGDVNAGAGGQGGRGGDSGNFGAGGASGGAGNNGGGTGGGPGGPPGWAVNRGNVQSNVGIGNNPGATIRGTL